MAASPLTSRPRGSNVNANGTGVADRFSTAVSDSVPSGRTLNVDRAAARLRRHDQLAPVGCEPDLPGRGEEVRRVGVREPERARRAVENPDAISADLEALHDPDPAGVQDVHGVVVDGDARREVAAGRVDVGQLEPRPVDAEDGHGVAAGVDCEQQPAPLVVDERALRAQAVRSGARCDVAAVAAGRVAARLGEPSVSVALEDDYPVAVELVGLDEDGAFAPPVAASTAVVGRDGPGGDECGERGGEDVDEPRSHGSPFDCGPDRCYFRALRTGLTIPRTPRSTRVVSCSAGEPI